MKFKKLIYGLACMTVSVSTAVSAFADTMVTKTVFESTDATEWLLKESNGAATIGNETLNTTNKTATGSTIILTKSDNDTIAKPVQVINTTKPPLTKGVKYTFSIDYTANLSSINVGTSNNAIYATVRSLYKDSNNKEKYDDTQTKAAVNAQSADKIGEHIGTITGTITPTVDNSYLEIQLYLRHSIGTVTFSNIKVTYEEESDEETTIPDDAIAKKDGSYITTAEDFATEAKKGGEIEILKDITTSRIFPEKDLTITGNGTLTTSDKSEVVFGAEKANITVGGKVKIDGHLTVKSKHTLTLKDNAEVPQQIKGMNVDTGTVVNIEDNATVNRIVTPAFNKTYAVINASMSNEERKNSGVAQGAPVTVNIASTATLAELSCAVDYDIINGTPKKYTNTSPYYTLSGAVYYKIENTTNNTYSTASVTAKRAEEYITSTDGKTTRKLRDEATETKTVDLNTQITGNSTIYFAIEKIPANISITDFSLN